MPGKRMPAKLMLIVVLMGLGAILELVGMQLFAAGISVALIVGVLVGNDGVRTFLRAAAAIEALWQIVVLAALKSWGAHGLIVAIALLGIAMNLYFVWALGQEDVRDWMFRKNFHLDENT